VLGWRFYWVDGAVHSSYTVDTHGPSGSMTPAVLKDRQVERILQNTVIG